MYILGIDTATNAGGVALGRNDEVVAVAMLKTPLLYSEKLLSYVDFVLSSLSISLDSVDLFAVSVGPGSFTGVRIGLATVKGFAQALGKPVVAISTLEALAYRFRHWHARIAPIIDARRQQIYAAVYRPEGQDIQIEQPEHLGRLDQWLRNLPTDDYLFVGDGALLNKGTVEALMPRSRLCESSNEQLHALCRLGYLRFRQGRAVDAKEVRANYLRPSDAEISRAGKP